MRQGQQNRRGRGRNNNRKGGHHQNPLSRSFESNGPDVKIRGTPAHIAEKYMALARDAQSSGDPVLAENYLQHAEHYGRIIMAYREQLNPPGEAGMNGNGQRMRGPGDVGEGGDDFGEDDVDQAGDEGFSQPFPPQTHAQQTRHDGGRHDGSNRHERPFRRDQGRSRDRFAERGDRNGMGERPTEGRPQPPQQDRQAEPAAEGGGGDARRRDRMQQPHEQPEFLRRPVRRVRSESEESGKDEPQD